MATAVTITSGEPELMVLGKILDYAGTIYTATVKNNPNDLWAGIREASIAVAEKALASKATKVLSTPTRNSKGQFLKGFNWITERRTTIKSQIGENILKSVFNKLLRSF